MVVICPLEGQIRTEACKARHKSEVWKTWSQRTAPYQILHIPLRHHAIQPIGARRQKRLRNVANQEGYFGEKEEKCHQKGSADNPIGLKITAWLADQSGNKLWPGDVMQVPGELRPGGLLG